MVASSSESLTGKTIRAGCFAAKMPRRHERATTPAQTSTYTASDAIGARNPRQGGTNDPRSILPAWACKNRSRGPCFRRIRQALIPPRRPAGFRAHGLLAVRKHFQRRKLRHFRFRHARPIGRKPPATVPATQPRKWPQDATLTRLPACRRLVMDHAAVAPATKSAGFRTAARFDTLLLLRQRRRVRQSVERYGGPAPQNHSRYA